MADLSFLFGDNTPASVNSVVQTTSETLPAWLQDYTRGLMGKSTQVAGEDYIPYTGARIADQTPDQLQANQTVRDLQGAWRPRMEFAGSQAWQIDPQTGQTNIQNYMNPYIDDVVSQVAALGQRNLSENLLPQLNQTFIGNGAFGGSRNFEFMDRAIRDSNESILRQQSDLLSQGYGQALNAFQNDAARAGNVANLSTQLGYQDVGMLDAIGQRQQALNQSALNLGYQDFVDQRDYPKAQLQFLNEIVRGLPTTKNVYQAQDSMPSTSYISPLQQSAAAFAGARGILTNPITAIK